MTGTATRVLRMGFPLSIRVYFPSLAESIRERSTRAGQASRGACRSTCASRSRHHDNAPRPGPDFDAARLLARRSVDDRHIVRGAVGHEERLPVGRDGEAPGALADRDGGDDLVLDGVENHHGPAPPG